MPWRIEFDPRALKELESQDCQGRRRLLAFLRDRVAQLDDPRSLDETLHGAELGRFWRYRSTSASAMALLGVIEREPELVKRALSIGFGIWAT